nr:MAG TPA: hypothetical protein [Caudoviricetes sp.]
MIRAFIARETHEKRTPCVKHNKITHLRQLLTDCHRLALFCW